MPDFHQENGIVQTIFAICLTSSQVELRRKLLNFVNRAVQNSLVGGKGAHSPHYNYSILN